MTISPSSVPGKFPLVGAGAIAAHKSPPTYLGNALEEWDTAALTEQPYPIDGEKPGDYVADGAQDTCGSISTGPRDRLAIHCAPHGSVKSPVKAGRQADACACSLCVLQTARGV